MSHEKLPIYLENGIGARLLNAMTKHIDEYIFSPDEFVADHEPTEFERLMLADFVASAFAGEVDVILQEAARAMLPASTSPLAGEDTQAAQGEAERVAEVGEG